MVDYGGRVDEFCFGWVDGLVIDCVLGCMLDVCVCLCWMLDVGCWIDQSFS